eukprot:134312-Ditylum_brightwellii.AAC.1
MQQVEKRWTDILRLRNVQFFKDGKLLDHSDEQLEYTDSISITFEWQKGIDWMDTVTQLSTIEVALCPVRQWSAIVRRTWSYKGANWDTPVSAVWRHGRIDHISSNEVIKVLRAAVKVIGEDRSSNVYVPGRMPSLYYNDDRTMVKQRFPPIH